AIREAKNAGYRNSVYIRELESELERAEVVPPQRIPGDVITMNSRVVLTDLENGEEMDLTLVFPNAGAPGEGKISVLAPIGTAMIGYRVNDVFDWDTPDGKRSLRVDRVLYQPEADGRYE
ncbi:MAG: nucleoside diphosphate kinase regulator, partial [Anaerolineaceae bacterium]